MDWVECSDRLPELGDYSVLVHFKHGGIDIAHVEDYFADITAGIKEGRQLYTKWYKTQKVTHWMLLPEPPKEG